jgi:hypothetical protein
MEPNESHHAHSEEAESYQNVICISCSMYVNRIVISFKPLLSVSSEQDESYKFYYCITNRYVCCPAYKTSYCTIWKVLVWKNPP